MEKIIKFEPAYDKRNPDPKKNYGVHGVTMGFYLKGELGTVQFTVFTNWHLSHVEKGMKHNTTWQYDDHVWCPFKPVPADLGYHSHKPIYENQSIIGENCEWTGGVCYYDGSTLNAEPIFDTLTKEGDKGVWRELENYYKDVFGELR